MLPTVLVVYGATGDLMTKKIVPALYHLYAKNELPKMFQMIGVARRPLTDAAFRERIADILTKHHVKKTAPEAEKFLKLFSYQQGNFSQKRDYTTLAKRLGQIDGSWRVCSNKLFYLAVPPEYFATIFRNLHASGMTDPCSPEEGWTRVIVEKPFGKNLQTAQKLDTLLGSLFKEEQIFRIDHYLAKEMLQNILTFRFANNLFETNWNNTLVESIDIRLWETLGVEERGGFYDGVGALRDIGQNHLLQILALLTMDHPRDLTAPVVREERTRILEQLIHPNLNDIKQTTLRAQYDGYQKIPGVAAGSRSETFFRIEAGLASPRWQGVPIRLEGGKRLHEQRKEVVVTFRHPMPCLCPPGGHLKNTVTFGIEPEERITIRFWSKKPGLRQELEERTFEFLYRNPAERRQYVEEYEKLLLDCLTGDQLLFVSTEEIKAMWQFIDPITRAWQKQAVPLLTYLPDTYPKFSEPQRVSETELSKTVSIIGLGKMGAGLAQQLLEKGWTVVGYNRSPDVTHALEKAGLTGVFSLKDIAKHIGQPRIIWLMLPAGQAVDDTLFGPEGLVKQLDRGDIIIDGGNSLYKDSIRRGKRLKKHGLRFLDIGVSGGPAGARNGACLMVGGDQKTFEYILPLLRDVALPGAIQFFPGYGAGHFVKMVHNGIEYGIMQAIAEGFAIMKAVPYELDLTQVAEIYNHGSVIESRLVGWLKKGFVAHGVELIGVKGSVAHTGEGAWTVEAAKELGIPAPIIEGALEFRKQSEKNPSYTGQILSALREQFGGHAISEK